MEQLKINRQQRDKILEKLGFDKDNIKCHYCKKKITPRKQEMVPVLPKCEATRIGNAVPESCRS